MSKKIAYTKAPRGVNRALDRGERVVGLIPPPDQLVRKTNVDVVITLNNKCLDFFIENARKNNMKYQTMINEVLENYVANQKKNHISNA